jgi:hypothetical protein
VILTKQYNIPLTGRFLQADSELKGDPADKVGWSDVLQAMLPEYAAHRARVVEFDIPNRVVLVEVEAEESILDSLDAIVARDLPDKTDSTKRQALMRRLELTEVEVPSP